MIKKTLMGLHRQSTLPLNSTELCGCVYLISQCAQKYINSPPNWGHFHKNLLTPLIIFQKHLKDERNLDFYFIF